MFSGNYILDSSYLLPRPGAKAISINGFVSSFCPISLKNKTKQTDKQKTIHTHNFISSRFLEGGFKYLVVVTEKVPYSVSLLS